MRVSGLVVFPAVLFACSAAEVAPTAAVAPATPVRHLPPIDLEQGERPSDCNIENPGAWDPMLAAVQSAGTAPVVTRGKQGIAETVALADGSEVRVVRGGCQHVGETWSVTPVPVGPHIAAVRAMIGKLALAPEKTSSLLPCLDDARDAEPAGFACREANVSRAVQGDVLEFTWSFAL